MDDLDSASEITVSTAKVGSSLAAALADIDRFTEQHMPPWSVIVAAARERLRLSKIPCETCGGSKMSVNRPDAATDEMPGYTLCPSCGGSGEVWPAELVEVVASVGIPRSHSARSFATAVLNALAVYAKEAK